MRRTSRQIGCVVAALLIAWPAGVLGGPKQAARAKFARATKEVKEGKLEEALADLEASYKLAPRAEVLYAIGQVDVKLGKCTEAAAAYKRFLAGNKDRDMVVRHSGMRRRRRPGIHNHDREYGFRARAARALRCAIAHRGMMVELRHPKKKKDQLSLAQCRD